MPPLTSAADARPADAADSGRRRLDDRLRGWITTLVITAIAAITRFANLGYPTDAGTPIFDEKHYAPQAWQVLKGGGLEANPGYELVVHPPLAKQLIAVGQAMFGYTGFGWRFASAVAGTILVLLVVRIARRMTGSTLLGAVAGLLLVADGVTMVASRTALLDIFLTVFIVAAFGALLVDRQQVIDRLARVRAEGRIEVSDFGPRLGFRWWRFGAGVLLGLACASKWGGLYYVAFFGLLSVMSDVAARRAHGVRRPWVGSLLRDTPAALASLVLVPIGVYLASFWAWFASETGVDRHIVGDGMKVGPDGAFTWVPDALRSLWHYSAHVLSFHGSLTNSAGNIHSWESKPWTWPMSLRPLLYYISDGDSVTGCGAEKCVSAVMIIGTPAMWWLALPVLGWALWRIATRQDWRYAWILVGYGAGFLPWFLNLDRQMYFFYAVPLAPFLILGLTMVLGEILGPKRAGAERRKLGLLLASGYVGLVVVNFIWLWPILTGSIISDERWQMELWLPSWR